MKIHFIGIGGIGISALARIFKQQGDVVSGSDLTESDLTRDLKSIGIFFYSEHNKEHVPEDVDKVIYTEAIPEDNPELKKARSLEIPCLTYFQALGEFAQDYKVIAVAGAHGKTTTTAMTALSLIAGGLDPTVVVGTKIREFNNTNVHVGKSEYLVVEACEYRESFLNLKPQILIITNVEAEHLDYYKNETNYLNAFRKLVSQVAQDGTILVLANDAKSLQVVEDAKADLIKLQMTNDELQIKKGGVIPTYPESKLQSEIKDSEKAGMKLQSNSHYQLPFLQLPGKHLKIDAGFAMAVGLSLGIKEEVIRKTLAEFKGTWRRFEYKGTKNGVNVLDDYAHHPTEIQATLKGAREKFPHQKIMCVFQPHQYSRTRLLFADFAKSFTDCDQVIVPNIYKVRDSEADVRSVSAEELVSAINQKSGNAVFGNGFENTVEKLQNTLNKGDILITMGAGPVNEVGESFLAV